MPRSAAPKRPFPSTRRTRRITSGWEKPMARRRIIRRMLSAYSWARKTQKEFETAVQLNERNFDAAQDLIEYDCTAPSMVGGGEDKAQPLIQKLMSLDAAEGHFAARCLQGRKEGLRRGGCGIFEGAGKQTENSGPHLRHWRLFFAARTRRQAVGGCGTPEKRWRQRIPGGSTIVPLAGF